MSAGVHDENAEDNAVNDDYVGWVWVYTRMWYVRQTFYTRPGKRACNTHTAFDVMLHTFSP